MSSEKISVIIPVYNTEKYIGRCLDSILNNTYKNLEVICVNDGSKDRSLEILNEYAEKDNRVKVIDKENGGVSAARNTALDVATGDFISFVDGKHYKSMIVDPSASSLIVTAHKRGITTRKANNDVTNGIRMVYTLLNTGHILINRDNCPNLIAELGLYIWNEKRGESGKEEVVKQHDHALDALRYAIYTTTPDSLVFGTN